MTVAVPNANRIRTIIRNTVADNGPTTFNQFHAALTTRTPRSTRAWQILADLAGVEPPTASTRRQVIAWLDQFAR